MLKKKIIEKTDYKQCFEFNLIICYFVIMYSFMDANDRQGCTLPYGLLNGADHVVPGHRFHRMLERSRNGARHFFTTTNTRRRHHFGSRPVQTTMFLTVVGSFEYQNCSSTLSLMSFGCTSRMSRRRREGVWSPMPPASTMWPPSVHHGGFKGYKR